MVELCNMIELYNITELYNMRLHKMLYNMHLHLVKLHKMLAVSHHVGRLLLLLALLEAEAGQSVGDISGIDITYNMGWYEGKMKSRIVRLPYS